MFTFWFLQHIPSIYARYQERYDILLCIRVFAMSLPAVPFERQLFVPCIDLVVSGGHEARGCAGVEWRGWLAKPLTKCMAPGLVHLCFSCSFVWVI